MINVTPQYLREQGLSATIVERFWREVVIVPYDRGCWLWAGCRSCGLYGMISNWPHNPIRTHVLSWLLHYGPVPEGEQVCHKCDVWNCVRPDHLWTGTFQENMRDKVAKGRQNRSVPWAVGELNVTSKLKPVEVLEIRRLYATRLYTQESIARIFGVDRTQIGNIVRRAQWSHI